jgi:two-component system cell cycle sensor histidine kinase/response regulator CckA
MSQPILLVDDDFTIVELVTSILRMAGYDVISADNGAEALHIAQNDRRICLVLSDIVMPEMSGIQLCEKLKILRPDVRCILMSGYNMGMMVCDWDAHFLPKPFFPQDLLSKVREVLALQEC